MLFYLKFSLSITCLLGFFHTASSSEMPSHESVTGTDYLSLHQFKTVHARGIRGEGMHIAFLEQAFELHPEAGERFLEDSVKLYDASHHPENYDVVSKRGQYIGKERPPLFYEKFLKKDTLKQSRLETDHATQVISLCNGKPIDGFLGGVAPQAKAHVYHYSRMFLRKDGRGSSIFSAIEFQKKYLNKQISPSYFSWCSLEDSGILQEEPIDESMTCAFNHIFSNPNIHVVNASTNLFNYADPFLYPLKSMSVTDILEGNTVQDSTKEWLAKGLEKNDQILVLAAGNQEENLSITSASTSPEHYLYSYKRSLLDHPVLKDRIVLALNITLDKPGGYCIKRVGNFPGDLSYLQEASLCAFGSNIYYGRNVFYDEMFSAWTDGEVRETGTSLSAPIIASYLALMKQTHPERSMLDIVRFVKKGAHKMADRTSFGEGIINTNLIFESISVPSHC